MPNGHQEPDDSTDSGAQPQEVQSPSQDAGKDENKDKDKDKDKDEDEDKDSDDDLEDALDKGLQSPRLARVMGILREKTSESSMKRRQPALRHQPTEEQLRTVNNIFSLIESIGNSRATLILALEEEMQKVYALKRDAMIFWRPSLLYNK